MSDASAIAEQAARLGIALDPARIGAILAATAPVLERVRRLEPGREAEPASFERLLLDLRPHD